LNLKTVLEYLSLQGVSFFVNWKTEDADIYLNFEEILEHSPEFNDLSAEMLEDISIHDELNVRSEEGVFQGVMKWTETRLQAR
jgi:hypothetical protein